MLKTVSSAITGQLNYLGTWNASTNNPTLTSGVGVKNSYYVVSTAGTTTLDGISNWEVGDWAIFNGTVWERVSGQLGTVTQVQGSGSVNGITLTGNVTSSGNLTLGGTLSGITNGQLQNSAVTVGNVTISLGGTTANLSNLTMANVIIQSGSIPSGNVTGLGTMATQNSNNVTITGGSINVTATNQVATTASTATYGTASLPLQPAGFMEVDLNGTVVKVPYYAV